MKKKTDIETSKEDSLCKELKKNVKIQVGTQLHLLILKLIDNNNIRIIALSRVVKALSPVAIALAEVG